jgi:hypothetical protein
VCAQVTQTKTGLSAVRTFSPLGVNYLLLFCLRYVLVHKLFFIL